MRRGLTCSAIISDNIFEINCHKKASTNYVEWKNTKGDEVENKHVLDYCHISEKTKLIVRYPSGQGRNIIFNYVIKKYAKILFVETLFVTKDELRNLIVELYRNHEYLVADKIDIKTEKCWSDSGKVMMYIFELYDDGELINMKHKLRTLFNVKRNSLHSTDYHLETITRLKYVMNKKFNTEH